MPIHFCRKGHQVKIMTSREGYYIGAEDLRGYPQCRLSETTKDPRSVSKLTVTREHCGDVANCNWGKGCCLPENLKFPMFTFDTDQDHKCEKGPPYGN